MAKTPNYKTAPVFPLPGPLDGVAQAQDPAPSAENALDLRLREERRLVEKVLEGSGEAWSEFVLRHTPLLLAAIRRNLFSRDEDDVRSVYVETLEGLHKQHLATFQGKSSLRAWLVLVARSHTMDFLRRRHGRHQPPRKVRTMRPRDRLLFKLAYEEGLGMREIREQLEARGKPAAPGEILEALDRIEACLDRRVLRRCEYDRGARMIGVASGRLLEYLDRVRADREATLEAESPDAGIREEETRRRLLRLQGLVRKLSEEDRRVLQLWYVDHRPAEEIAATVPLRDRRRVYTILARCLRILRRGFERPLDREGHPSPGNSVPGSVSRR